MFFSIFFLHEVVVRFGQLREPRGRRWGENRELRSIVRDAPECSELRRRLRSFATRSDWSKRRRSLKGGEERKWMMQECGSKRERHRRRNTQSIASLKPGWTASSQIFLAEAVENKKEGLRNRLACCRVYGQWHEDAAFVVAITSETGLYLDMKAQQDMYMLTSKIWKWRN